jgi:uncharacterized protein YdaU (DUF1376 family)
MVWQARPEMGKGMSKLLSMPFLVDKYLADTDHLSLEEHGAYCLLLFRMWQRGGSLPDQDKDLARMLGVSQNAWKKLKSRLGNFFEFHGGLIMQKRLQKQWNYAMENSIRSKAKASFAAKRRWEKERGLKSINGVLQAMPHAYPKQCPSDAILKKEDISIPLSNSSSSKEGALKKLLETPLMKRNH